jgi:hypothetical protein
VRKRENKEEGKRRREREEDRGRDSRRGGRVGGRRRGEGENEEGRLLLSGGSFGISILLIPPRIIDTKHLANHPQIFSEIGTRSSLEDLGTRIDHTPFSGIPFSEDSELEGGFHNAGYDAYVTGKVFVAFGNKLTRGTWG